MHHGDDHSNGCVDMDSLSSAGGGLTCPSVAIECANFIVGMGMDGFIFFLICE